MAKAPSKSSARKSGTAAASARPRAVAATRTLKRGNGGTATARAAKPVARKRDDEAAVTRVTHETEVRGTETRVERVVERAPKPSLPDVDRSAGDRKSVV